MKRRKPTAPEALFRLFVITRRDRARLGDTRHNRPGMCRFYFIEEPAP